MTNRTRCSEPAAEGMNRRSFLKTGLGGAIFLGGVSLTASLSGCSTAPAGVLPSDDTGVTASNGYPFRFLTRDDIVLFEALLPAIIGPGLPEAPVQRRQLTAETIERIDAGIVQFGSANQNELRKLLDLLNFGVTRITLARVWSNWQNVTTTEAEAFLARWRNSSFGLLNNGYMALIKLTNVAFYGHEDHWQLSGYPGPPAWAIDALPQFNSPT